LLHRHARIDEALPDERRVQVIHPPFQLAPRLIVRRQDHRPDLLAEHRDPDAGRPAIGIGQLQGDTIGKGCRWITIPIPTGQVACLTRRGVARRRA
jgi:hypothetical protein